MNSLLKYEPKNSLSQIFEDFFNEAGYEAIDRHISDGNWPKVDIAENDSNYLLKADLPGMERNDYKITVENGILRIEGEKKEEHREKKGSYYHFERTYGKFSRSFVLPEEVDGERIEAKMEKGVLELILPKNEKSKPKMIQITVQ